MSVPMHHLHQLLAQATAHRWLFDFLFNNDPLADLVILRTQPSNSFLYNTVTTTKEPTNSHYELLDETTHTISLCLPHFTADSITAGLIVHERNDRRQIPLFLPPLSKPQLEICRFARFSSPNCSLQVRALPDRSALHLTLTLLPSTKRQSRLRFIFNGDPFGAHCSATGATSYPSVDDLRISLAKFSKSELCRSCPRCHVPPTTSCQCDQQLNLIRPEHPYDLSTERRRHSLYRGTYTGVVMVDFLTNGDPALHASLDCTFSVDAANDPKAMVALRERAVHQSALQVSLMKDQKSPFNTSRCNDENHRHTVVENSLTAESDNDFASTLAEVLIQEEQMKGAKVELIKDESKIMSLALPQLSNSDEMTHDLYRKTRNRLSAARSNMKRKWRNRSMRLQVVILRQMLNDLREKENSLKFENEWLSRQCFSH